MRNLAKIPLWGSKDEKIREKIDGLRGLNGQNDRYKLKNIQIVSGGLRTHAPLVRAVEDARLTDVRAFYPFDDKLLILNMEGGYIGFYAYDGQTVKKQYVTVQTYPLDFDGSSFSSGLVYTEDGSVHIDEGNDLPKLLYFPAYSYSLVQGGAPGMLRAMPPEVPKLEFAAVAGGRMYGILGQKAYVSGENGCFDWQTDQPADTQPVPGHAWSGKITTATEKQLPVKALKGYRDYMLIFRENALQKITGNSNPYAVKDLFRVGTSCAGSVKELDGEIYFIGQGEIYRFNGSGLRKLPPLPASVKILGPACVYGQNYCFYAENGEDKLIYGYDPKTDTYGVTAAPGRVTDFALCGRETLALVDSGSKKEIYKFSEDRSNVAFDVVMPLADKEHRYMELTGVSLRFVGNSASNRMELYVHFYDDQSTVGVHTLGKIENGVGRITMRARTRIRGATLLDLEVRGRGDVNIESLEVHYRPKIGKKWKV